MPRQRDSATALTARSMAIWNAVPQHLREQKLWGFIAGNNRLMSPRKHTIKVSSYAADFRKIDAVKNKHRVLDTSNVLLPFATNLQDALVACQANNGKGVGMLFDHNSPICAVKLPNTTYIKDPATKAKAQCIRDEWEAKGFVVGTGGWSMVPEAPIKGKPCHCDDLDIDMPHTGYVRYYLGDQYQDLTIPSENACEWLSSQIEPRTFPDTGNHNLNVALWWAGQGIRVFPSHTNPKKDKNGKVQKNPAIFAWPQKSTTSPKQIKEWWADLPDTAPSIHSGPNGFVVIDLDVKPDDGIDGIASFKALCAEHGLAFPPIYTVRTQGGGLHLYLRVEHVPLMKNWGSKLGNGIDTRTGNGQTIAPYTVTVEQGKTYTPISTFPIQETAILTPEMDKVLCDIVAANKAPKIRSARPARATKAARQPKAAKIPNALSAQANQVLETYKSNPAIRLKAERFVQGHYDNLETRLLDKIAKVGTAATRDTRRHWSAEATRNGTAQPKEINRNATLFACSCQLANYINYAVIDANTLEAKCRAALEGWYCDPETLSRMQDTIANAMRIGSSNPPTLLPHINKMILE